MMKRIVLVVTVALVVAVMAVAPAFATVHPLACSERSQAPEGTAAETQDPPGLTGQSQGKPPNNPEGGTIAQPVFQASPNAFKDEGC
jgi:hypothetical protein